MLNINRSDAQYWRDKYMDLLEQYHKVMSELEKIVREEKI